MLRDKLSLLPDSPGCYLMKDKHNTIIYVGKAKNLKNRVKSYFNGAHEGKTLRLVNEIVDFEYIITTSELEAFVLELNLIKQYDPKYNILLKDDKTYPYIKITDELHPRLLVVRDIKRKGGRLFGPYPNVLAAKETVNLLNQIYPLRKCETIPKKECLYFHIHKCLAPCIKKIDTSTYGDMTIKIANFLKGDYKDVIDDLNRQMIEASENLNFERAKECRDTIEHIKATVEKQKVQMNDFKDRDVFGYYVDKGWICIQVFYMRSGKLIERKASLFPLIEDAEEEFVSFVAQFYTTNVKPQEILLPAVNDTYLEQYLDIKVLTPTKGDKKKLIDMAMHNAEVGLKEKFALIERDEERTYGAIEALGRALKMDTPYRIEAFDNSNIMGVDAVSAMVVFIDGKPAKKEYRKYKIKTVEGPDDYGSMREVVYRRYFRVLMDGLPMPDLIVIDGGKGQINAARDVIKELGLHINVVGLKKDDKHKTSELLAHEPLEVVPLARNSNEFYLLQRIQDEVHRFAITFHQQTRSKSTFATILDDVEGVGESRKKKLLKHFKSLKRIKEAELSELETILPTNVAKNLYDKLNS